MITPEGLCALVAPILLFLAVWLVVRPAGFDSGHYLRLVGWEMATVSLGFVLVAFWDRRHSVLGEFIERSFGAGDYMGVLIAGVGFFVVYCLAARVRYIKLHYSERDASERFSSGAFLWLVGSILIVVSSNLAQRR